MGIFALTQEEIVSIRLVHFLKQASTIDTFLV